MLLQLLQSVWCGTADPPPFLTQPPLTTYVDQLMHSDKQ